MAIYSGPVYPLPSVIIITCETHSISLSVHISLSFSKRCISLHFFNFSLYFYNISIFLIIIILHAFTPYINIKDSDIYLFCLALWDSSVLINVAIVHLLLLQHSIVWLYYNLFISSINRHLFLLFWCYEQRCYKFYYICLHLLVCKGFFCRGYRPIPCPSPALFCISGTWPP